jgi:hypothetical protein
MIMLDSKGTGEPSRMPAVAEAASPQSAAPDEDLPF